ncbi:DNA-deoxyinosine glycosylase [Chitinilyticum litopenaei]|uniref:DNA-deoxyinosine glycosylase n=1 Tax=Chitinilyticum litopenaei TaxID=1121276 RepID=UPI0004042A06|nr:DNA-deoxyinosine glycosylase [Chitinilyticum litopenaei]
MSEKRSFAPVAAAHCRILVLGTLPGEASLAAGEYYAHPRNAFWPIMAALTGQPLADCDWPQRYATLLQHGIALWDTVASASRQGSLDAALREVATNPLSGLIATLPALRLIACNGQTAHRLARQSLGDDARLLALPSTSPAFTRPLADKLAAWQAALAPILPPS